MTELRFPGCLNWEIHVDEKCRNASVFPIILLMFTENTIKHNMIMGEELRVRITGSLVRYFSTLMQNSWLLIFIYQKYRKKLHVPY